jgi:hypothetical protein
VVVDEPGRGQGAGGGPCECASVTQFSL